jgi:hypothetical protein
VELGLQIKVMLVLLVLVLQNMVDQVVELVELDKEEPVVELDYLFQ